MVDLAKGLITSESEMWNSHRTVQRTSFYAAVQASQWSSTSSGLQRTCRIMSSAFHSASQQGWQLMQTPDH